MIYKKEISIADYQNVIIETDSKANFIRSYLVNSENNDFRNIFYEEYYGLFFSRSSTLGYDKAVIVYESDSEIQFNTKEYKNDTDSVYFCNFISEINAKRFLVSLPLLSETDAEMSMNINLKFMDINSNFDVPVNSKYIASLNNSGLPVSGNRIVGELKSSIDNSTYYVSEYVNKKTESEDITLNGNIFELNQNYEIVVTVEVRIFSVKGEIEFPPYFNEPILEIIYE